MTKQFSSRDRQEFIESTTEVDRFGIWQKSLLCTCKEDSVLTAHGVSLAIA